MKSGAEPRTPLSVRGAALLDRVDYRLIETPEEKDPIYLMRYRAYLHARIDLAVRVSARHAIVMTMRPMPGSSASMSTENSAALFAFTS